MGPMGSVTAFAMAAFRENCAESADGGPLLARGWARRIWASILGNYRESEGKHGRLPWLHSMQAAFRAISQSPRTEGHRDPWLG